MYNIVERNNAKYTMVFCAEMRERERGGSNFFLSHIDVFSVQYEWNER